MMFVGETVIQDTIELDSEQETTTESGSIQRRRDLVFKIRNIIHSHMINIIFLTIINTGSIKTIFIRSILPNPLIFNKQNSISRLLIYSFITINSIKNVIKIIIIDINHFVFLDDEMIFCNSIPS